MEEREVIVMVYDNGELECSERLSCKKMYLGCSKQTRNHFGGDMKVVSSYTMKCRDFEKR